MDVLATLVGCFTAVTPLVVLAAAVATLDYRISGTDRDPALQRATAGVLLSIGWSASLALLLGVTHWQGPSQAWLPSVAHIALAIAPVLLGGLPSGVLFLLAYGPSSGTPDQRPLWREWLDAY